MAGDRVPSRQLYIDGEWKAPILGKWIAVVNPSTEEIIGDIPAATTEDVELAINVAQRAFNRNRGRDWVAAPGAVRAKYLRAIAAKISGIFLGTKLQTYVFGANIAITRQPALSLIHHNEMRASRHEVFIAMLDMSVHSVTFSFDRGLRRSC